MKILRNIVEIDEERCNGCGQCVRDCAEGAIALVDGKAKVLADFLCDGLGACLGGCPQDALRIVRREADAFDEQAVLAHMDKNPAHTAHPRDPFTPQGHLECGCSSSHARVLEGPAVAGLSATASAATVNRHWPVKLRLVPPTAPFLRGAHIVIAADCAATASPLFHSWATGKVVLIACPKFEEAQTIVSKLAAIITYNAPASVTVLRMEVPCCQGLVALCEQAALGSTVTVKSVVMGCSGAILPA